MATKNAVNTHTPAPGDVRAWGIAWGPLLNGDVGNGIDVIDYADRTIQVEGNFGVGGSLRLEGSNDGVNWRVLHDPLGTTLNITSASIVQVSEVTAKMRPNVTAGDGATSLTATMFARRTSR